MRCIASVDLLTLLSHRIRDCVPCTGCSGVLFCCLACREEALNTYHRFECRIQDLLHASGMSVTCLLSLRLATRVTAEQLLEIRPRLNEPPSGPYSGEDYENIYRLVSHGDRRTPEALFPLTLMAVFMLRCLQFQGYFGDGEFQGCFGDGEFQGYFGDGEFQGYFGNNERLEGRGML